METYGHELWAVTERMKQIEAAAKLVFFVRWLGSVLEGGELENPEGL